MNSLIVLAILLLLFWFILVRPQRTRAREQQQLIQELEPGDEIVSAGGLYGTITEVEDEVLHVEIAPGLVVRMARAAVAGIVETEEAADEDEAPDETALDASPATPPTPGRKPGSPAAPPGEPPESRYPEEPVDGTS